MLAIHHEVLRLLLCEFMIKVVISSDSLSDEDYKPYVGDAMAMFLSGMFDDKPLIEFAPQNKVNDKLYRISKPNRKQKPTFPTRSLAPGVTYAGYLMSHFTIRLYVSLVLSDSNGGETTRNTYSKIPRHQLTADVE